jgi:predicted MPP superfamily phosphohydrolase
MISRRTVLQGAAAFGIGSVALSGYALAVEPMRHGLKRYAVTPPGWTAGLRLRIVGLADIHACEPWMSADRVASLAADANALQPDLIVLLGDYAAAHRLVTRKVAADAWAEALAVCRAPLGVHAVMGNHDWWDDKVSMARGGGPVEGRVALERRGIPVYENGAVRLVKDGKPFWVAGLADQIAFIGRRKRQGLGSMADLPGTLLRVTDDAPVILLAHEPDIFPNVTDRVALTLCGHTHGGQVRVMGYAPVVPSNYGNRFAYGHIVEGNRHMIVSAGLGCSVLPVRLGAPPEIVVVEVGA